MQQPLRCSGAPARGIPLDLSVVTARSLPGLCVGPPPSGPPWPPSGPAVHQQWTPQWTPQWTLQWTPQWTPQWTLQWTLQWIIQWFAPECTLQGTSPNGPGIKV